MKKTGIDRFVKTLLTRGIVTNQEKCFLVAEVDGSHFLGGVIDATFWYIGLDGSIS